MSNVDGYTALPDPGQVILGVIVLIIVVWLYLKVEEATRP